MFKTNKNYIFESFEAEMFHRIFNDYIRKYGHITVPDLFEDPFLLGSQEYEKDLEEFTKIIYFRVGWNKPIPATKMFKIQESKRGGIFEYVLNLPDYESL